MSFRSKPMLRVPGPQTRERLTTMTCNGAEAASLFGKTRKNPWTEGKGNLITGIKRCSDKQVITLGREPA